MNHLPYIAASYAIFVVVTLAMAAGAAIRLRRATRRLGTLDRRGGAA
jgi:hypothetical protein